MLVAKTSFSWSGRVFQEGTSVADDDPVVKGREHLFETVEERHVRVRGGVVERATAGPGEIRNVQIPKKRTSAKKASAKKDA